MRRLLAPMALVAALLLLPVASAQGAPAPDLAPLASPTGSAAITLTWSDVGALPGTTYRVWRAPGACPAAYPGDFTQRSGNLVDTFTYDDTLPAEGAYCYVVDAEDLVPLGATPSNQVAVVLDTAPPVISVTPSGGDGCITPFTFTATASDQLPVSLTVDSLPYTAGTVYAPVADPYTSVSPIVGAVDSLGHPASPVPVPGRVLDPTGPGPVTLEIDTEPAQQMATLSWLAVDNTGAPVTYRVRTKGPQGPSVTNNLTSPVVRQNLQVDATYEFTLEAVDACLRLTSSVKLVRLNDSTPPSMPIVAGPAFNAATHVVSLSWIASTDNIQVDHYVIVRNGVPLGATDATTFTDVLPTEHAQLSYVVRAVDTNGNATDSAPAPVTTPDWTPPTAPVPTLTPEGTTIALRWPPAGDNVGVVGYDVLRDNKLEPIASMTAAVRSYVDRQASPGLHTWRVRARDDAGLSATSAPQSFRVAKARARASVLSTRAAGGGSGAARYSLKARARLLVDVRVVGTVANARLRVYVNSGRGRITVWRGMPGSSAPRVRLGSALARGGFVTIRLGRTLHTGRVRLVLIPSGRMVIVAKGKRAPAMKIG